MRSSHRRGFTVALIGPDGAGKTTIARRLEETLPLPVKYLYMGVNPDSSNHLLLTTRLVRAIKRARGIPVDANRGGAPQPERRRPRSPLKRTLRTLKLSLSLLNRIVEEWHRQLLASFHVRRGRLVVFDRHFFSDYYAADVKGGRQRPIRRRIHGFLLTNVYPHPDLVIYLDAPPEVLLARKGEGTLESLARRRREYLSLPGRARNFHVVDASRPLEEVTAEVARLIERFAGGAAVESRRATRSAR